MATLENVSAENAGKPFGSDVHARQVQILSEMSASETPRVGLLLTIIIGLFGFTSAVTRTSEPPAYYLLDLVQGLAFLTAAWLVWTRRVPNHHAPAAFAAALVVSNVMLNAEYLIDPVPTILGTIMITMAASGALILMWRPFIAASAISTTVTTVTLMIRRTDATESWIITLFLAVAVSAILLFGRIRSARTMAIASLTIEEIATRDPLTGLLNRRGLQLASGTVVSMAFRGHEPLFAVFVDIVGLKKVNDAFGHTTGDLVITRVARAVEAISRGSDLVTRWGGDEFLVIGIGPQPDELDYLQRIRSALDLTGLDDRWPGLVSLGAAYDDSCDIDALISAADAAMYDARAVAHLRDG